MLLNLGCGANRPAGWINVDCSLNSLLQTLPLVGKPLARLLIGSTMYDSANVRYMNLNKRWPYSDGAVDLVYGSHVFEHLALPTTRLFLAEARRCLKPGGVIRLVVPDLYAAAKQYVDLYEQRPGDHTERLLYVLNLHQLNAYSENEGRFRRFLGFMQGYPHQHKYMYDRHSLRRRLQDVGFVDILEASYAKSEHFPRIGEVECTAEGVPSVYLEARQP